MNRHLVGNLAMLLVLMLASLHSNCAAEEPAGPVEIDNGKVQARFTVTPDGVRQEYLAKRDHVWVGVATSPASPVPAGLAGGLYDSSRDPEHRLMVGQCLTTIDMPRRDGNRVSVHMSGERRGQVVEMTVTLEDGQPRAHVEFSAHLKGEPAKLEYLLWPLEIRMVGKPDFSHSPGLEPTAESVIGDRVFFSPAAMVQKGAVFAAIVPDLDLMGRDVVYAKNARQQTHPKIFAVPVDPAKIPMPHALIVDVQSAGAGPVIGFGMMDWVVNQHVWFSHDSAPGKMVRELSSKRVRCGLDLFVAADAPENRGYAAVSRFLWERYGSRSFQMPRPQAMPLPDYAKICYQAYDGYQGYDVAEGSQSLKHRKLPERPDMNSWQQWELDGKPVGAYRLTAPQWYDQIAFMAWWNNANDAIGMHYWAKRLGDPKLLDKAKRIVNLALSAPQKQGMFPSLYHLKQKRWIGSMWNFPARGYDPGKASTYWDWEHGAYHGAAASVTASYLLEYRRLCEDEPRILEFAKRYAEFVLAHTSKNGIMPSWFNAELNHLPVMAWNAEGGAHAWMLAELYRATKEPKYLEGAKRLADFLVREVIPNQRWADFETFFSCAVKAENFFDARTGQPGRDTMAMIWALQAFTSLYEVTGDRAWLNHATAMADYMGFWQTVWAPPYVITAYPFGGWSSQLGDADWLDIRSHRIAGPMARIGLLAGRQDLVERGVALARSSFTLVAHPRHSANHIYDHTDFPIGLGPENIDHEGFPQKPLSSGPSWSSVGALAGAADVLRLMGGIHLDIKHNVAVGVDGVAVQGFSRHGPDLHLKLLNQLGALASPYEKPYTIKLNITGATQKQLRLSINGGDPVVIDPDKLNDLVITVGPSQQFHLTATAPK